MSTRPSSPSCVPGAIEQCNYLDDNCDGNVDEGAFVSPPASVGQLGVRDVQAAQTLTVPAGNALPVVRRNRPDVR
mgnify:CR=1 FL=1